MTDLGQRDDGPRGGLADREAMGDGVQQRLGVIEVRDGDTPLAIASSRTSRRGEPEGRTIIGRSPQGNYVVLVSSEGSPAVPCRALRLPASGAPVNLLHPSASLADSMLVMLGRRFRAALFTAHPPGTAAFATVTFLLGVLAE